MDPFSIPPAKYWRESKKWKDFIGQTGVVVASTLIHFGLPELSMSNPYWLILVQLQDKTIKMFLGADGFSYKKGDEVVCVLRRVSSTKTGLIHYRIKAMPHSPRSPKPNNQQ